MCVFIDVELTAGRASAPRIQPQPDWGKTDTTNCLQPVRLTSVIQNQRAALTVVAKPVVERDDSFWSSLGLCKSGTSDKVARS